jgi:hypothetical protein
MVWPVVCSGCWPGMLFIAIGSHDKVEFIVGIDREKD